MAAFKFTSYELMVAGSVSAVLLAILLIIKVFGARQLRRFTAQGAHQFFSYPEQLIDATRLPFILAAALLAGFGQLELSTRHERWVDHGWIVILVSQIALWGNRIISVVVQRAFKRQLELNPAGATHLVLTGLVARIVLWSIATLMALDNLGFNISTLMASLGIGGIAVALALQNILGDIFSSISIALDKPFVIGDFIVVDTFMGTVEYVGMKTTRLLSLGGEQIIFSNTELLKNRIRNYKRMQERRVLFEFGVPFETSIEDVEWIPKMVKEIVDSGRFATRFDRAHFKGNGDSTLLFEVVYYVLDPDYNKYMDIQQAINLAMLRQLRQRAIGYGYPTRTMRVTPPNSALLTEAAT